MINWIKEKAFKEYEDRLLKAFPKSLKHDVEEVLKILPFSENEVKLFDGQIHKVENLIHPLDLTLKLENETLTIPRRHYFNEPDAKKEAKLIFFYAISLGVMQVKLLSQKKFNTTFKLLSN